MLAPASTRVTTRNPISQSPQSDRWPGTRWTHQRVPDHWSSRQDRTMWRGARIMVQTMAMQLHAPLQITQLHTAINACMSTTQSYFCRSKTWINLIVHLFNTEVGTETQRRIKAVTSWWFEASAMTTSCPNMCCFYRLCLNKFLHFDISTFSGIDFHIFVPCIFMQL